MDQHGPTSSPLMLPIGAVARLTGVPEMTLRNWEKRFGMLRPRRSAVGGHRLYGGDDITLVRHLTQYVVSGTPIRKAVAAMRAI